MTTEERAKHEKREELEKGQAMLAETGGTGSCFHARKNSDVRQRGSKFNGRDWHFFRQYQSKCPVTRAGKVRFYKEKACQTCQESSQGRAES